jgi:molybdopterin/thiamine biosynthesis adenylyltransferase
MRHYIVIGAGGTASHLFHALVLYAQSQGDHQIHVWDKDVVEEKNLERQLFYPFEIGKHKAKVFEERYPNVIAHLEWVGEDNISDVIKNNDTVLVCADNMAVRRVINDHCKTLNDITCINGGNEKHTGSVQLFQRRHGKPETPALDFRSPEFDAANDEEDRSHMSCAEIAVLPGGEQTMIANQTVAAMMMAALWRADTRNFDRGEERTWTKLTFDHEMGQVQTSDVRMLQGWADES